MDECIYINLVARNAIFCRDLRHIFIEFRRDCPNIYPPNPLKCRNPHPTCMFQSDKKVIFVDNCIHIKSCCTKCEFLRGFERISPLIPACPKCYPKSPKRQCFLNPEVPFLHESQLVGSESRKIP